jgi:HK97 gp10 family phage protein
MDRGVATAAGMIADLASQLAPVDTGALRASIRVEGTEGSRRRRVVAGAPHARFVEYGTVTNPAQPFMTPAAEAIDVRREVRNEVQALIRRRGR